jgi:hypothetical protein
MRGVVTKTGPARTTLYPYPVPASGTKANVICQFLEASLLESLIVLRRPVSRDRSGPHRHRGTGLQLRLAAHFGSFPANEGSVLFFHGAFVCCPLR